MNTNRNKKMRLVKEVVFHNGLLKHQLFSEKPLKWNFPFFEKISARRFFHNPKVARLDFTCFYNYSWGTFNMSTNGELQLIRILNFLALQNLIL